MKLKAVFLAALLLTPAAALAAPGIVTASVSMRAGPGQGFPTVDRIPGGARVNIHGCIRGDAWCDVSWSGDRGWVSSQYLQYFYRNRYVYLPDYVDVVDVPIVAFELDSYWANYYPGRPWYQRRAYWSSYWQSHARFATQVPAERSARSGNTARFGNTERRAAITEGRTRPGVAQGFTREQRFDRTQGRLAHVNGAGRTLPGAQQPMVRGHEATRFSRPATTPHIAQPNVAHIAQPNMGRVGGPPQNARAQMGGPRAAPAMPQAGGGGAPHVNAAPRAGGGPAGGGAPGREHH